MGRQTVGASILPFSVDPRGLGIYVWLAQERWLPQWPQGSLTWSDFGGKCAVGDPDAAATAAREFHEESLAVLPVTEAESAMSSLEIVTKGVRTDPEELAEELRAGDFHFRLLSVFSETHQYVTFVKQVPWRPESRDLFRNLASRVRDDRVPATHAVSGDAGVAEDCYREKVAIALFSVPQLRRICSGRAASRSRRGFIARLEAILDQFPADGMLAPAIPPWCGHRQAMKIGPPCVKRSDGPRSVADAEFRDPPGGREAAHGEVR